MGGFNRLDDFAGIKSDPQSLHKYAYCHGSPVNGIDPSGTFSLTLVGMLATVGLILVLATFYLGALIPARKKAERQLKIVQGLTSPIGPSIAKVMARLRQMNQPIPNPINIQDPSTTWNSIEEELLYAIGDGTFLVYDLEKKVGNGSDVVPYSQKALGGSQTTLFIHTVNQNFTYKGHPYNPTTGKEDTSKPTREWPWEAALAHEIMHIYRNITGQRTNDKLVEEVQIAVPVGNAYRKFLGYND